MANLTQLEARVSAMLSDASVAVFGTGVLDEAFRMALSDLNGVCPQAFETVITLPAVGKEIALDGITGLLHVLDVWWPYDSLEPTIEPQHAPAWRLYWDDSRPVLLLGAGSDIPNADDEVRVFYDRSHTIEGLDGAEITTIGDAESMIVRGAAGYACLSRSVDLNEASVTSQVETPNYGALAQFYLNEPRFGFHALLETLRRSSRVRSEPWPARGWVLDEWDSKVVG